MLIITLLSISFPFLIFVLLLYGMYKGLIKKSNITAYYTPFDEITGQSYNSFQDEQEMEEEEDDQEGEEINKLPHV